MEISEKIHVENKSKNSENSIIYYEKIKNIIKNNFNITEKIEANNLFSEKTDFQLKIYKNILKSLDFLQTIKIQISQKYSILFPYKSLLKTCSNLLFKNCKILSKYKKIEPKWKNFIFEIFIRLLISAYLILPDNFPELKNEIILDEIKKITQNYKRGPENHTFQSFLQNSYSSSNKKSICFSYLFENPIDFPISQLNNEICIVHGEIIFPKNLPGVIEFDHSFPYKLTLKFNFNHQSVFFTFFLKNY